MRPKIIAQWVVPKEAMDAAWRVNVEQFKQGVRYFVKWGLAGTMLLLVLKEPLNMPLENIAYFVVSILVLNLMLYSQIWILRFKKNFRAIRENGLFQMPPAIVHSWKNMEWFGIGSDSSLPELKVLVFKTRIPKKLWKWHFNPKEVPEELIRNAIKSHGVLEKGV